MSLANAQKPWLAEKECTLDDAKAALLESDAPSIENLRALSHGWDNTVFIGELSSGECVSVRFPRREIALSLLNAEATLLPLVCDALSVDAPYPLFAGGPTRAFDWPFVVSRFVSGQTLCRAKLSAEKRRALLPQVSRFLSELHNINVKQAREAGALFDEHARTSMKRLRVILDERLPVLLEKDVLSKVQCQKIERVFDEAHEHSSVDLCLCHGDLYARHLVIENDALKGVIDWGDVHVGCPSKDLAILFALSPEDPFAFYEMPDEPTQKRALCCALFSSVMILVFGLDIDDEALAHEGKRNLDALCEIIS